MDQWKYLKWSSLYFVSVIAGSCALKLYSSGWDSVLSFDFLVWDAKVVYRVVQEGYDYYSVAFYPLFPWVWKLLSVGPVFISVVNGILFIGVISVIGMRNKMSRTSFLLHLSWPSLLFMFLPYSEALLCLLTYGFLHYRSKESFLIAGLFLFLMSLTKPTASIMLPAMCLAEYMSVKSSWTTSRRIVFFSSVVLAGNLWVWFMQFLQTGEWLIFFRAQSEIWQQSLSFPKFPLATWDSNYVIWLDAASLFFTGVAAVYSWMLLRDRILHQSRFDVAWVYSVVALAGTGMFVLCFRHGMLFSLNRFVFASVFFMYLSPRGIIRPPLFKFISSPVFYGVLALIVSIACGGYQHIRLSLAFAALSTLLVSFVIFGWFRHHRWISYILIALLWGASVYYGQRILSEQWVA